MLWRGGLALLFLSLFINSSQSQSESTSLKTKNPQELTQFLTNLLEVPTKRQDFVLKFLDFYPQDSSNLAIQYPFERKIAGRDGAIYKVSIDFAHLQYGTGQNSYYDRTATIWNITNEGGLTRIAEVDWNSKKTGNLPGPEASNIRFKDYSIKFEDMAVEGKLYYKTKMEFISESALRGYIEILQDVEKQRTKISVSLIEGPVNILPSQMTQLNLQATIESKGYIYLRKEETVATRIASEQQHFCRNPQGDFVHKNSREWEESCKPLFDESNWHGFSFSLIPHNYEVLLKGPLER